MILPESSFCLSIVYLPGFLKKKKRSMSFKNSVYRIAKGCKLFALSSHLTKHCLRILCFHGFSFVDEHLFRPKLFQTPELFEQRMQWLKRSGFQAIGLDEALMRLEEGKLDGNEVAITIDDGFYSVFALAAPILKKVGFTATIYVTTYYVIHNNPIFRLVLQYLFWKTSLEEITMDDLVEGLAGVGATKGKNGSQTLWKIIDIGETKMDELRRVNLAREIAKRLNVSFDELAFSRRLTLMTEEETSDLASQGFDIQLHTHRHRLPLDSAAVKQELDDNRAVLRPTTTRLLHHLCYPSGEWSQSLWPILKSEGIKTATTCEPGLVSSKTSPLAWTRFLDSQTTPQIVFEAEVSGFAHLLRKTLSR